MSHCVLVNTLCPDDLCVLPAGHPGTSKREHLLGSMYGSADPDLDGAPNPKYRERVSPLMFMAPPDTPVNQLITLGRERAKEIWP